MIQQLAPNICKDRDTQMLALCNDGGAYPSQPAQYLFGSLTGIDTRTMEVLESGARVLWGVAEPSRLESGYAPFKKQTDLFAEIDTDPHPPTKEATVTTIRPTVVVCRNPNHPMLGDTIKVDPIRSIEAINRIKQQLFTTSPRNFALFVVGINTAYRASELLSLRVGQVRPLQPGDRLEVKQKKTKKYRAVTINCACYDALQAVLAERKKSQDASWLADDAYLFAGRHPDRPLLTSTLNNLVKRWCHAAELTGNFGSHSLRKTWGFMQRTQQDASIPLLMRAFGHSTQQQTLAYLCIQDEEIDSIYTSLEL